MSDIQASEKPQKIQTTATFKMNRRAQTGPHFVGNATSTEGAIKDFKLPFFPEPDSHRVFPAHTSTSDETFSNRRMVYSVVATPLANVGKNRQPIAATDRSTVTTAKFTFDANDKQIRHDTILEVGRGKNGPSFTVDGESWDLVEHDKGKAYLKFAHPEDGDKNVEVTGKPTISDDKKEICGEMIMAVSPALIGDPHVGIFHRRCHGGAGHGMRPRVGFGDGWSVKRIVCEIISTHPPE
ncbi:hypothetical protein FB451DRAFT_1189471 [Mycena latifolia]|nr:hypothetical protein FB451DRAFT_1189471 [Mycena latifolia]